RTFYSQPDTQVMGEYARWCCSHFAGRATQFCFSRCQRMKPFVWSRKSCRRANGGKSWEVWLVWTSYPHTRGVRLALPITTKTSRLSLLEHRRRLALIWSRWSLGATVHANDWREISISLIGLGPTA